VLVPPRVVSHRAAKLFPVDSAGGAGSPSEGRRRTAFVLLPEGLIQERNSGDGLQNSGISLAHEVSIGICAR
jgi:hypothetical protein